MTIRTSMKDSKAMQERQDELVGELQMIVGWGGGFAIQRHPMGVTVMAERIPAEAIALTSRIPCLKVVDISHHYEDDEPVASVKFGWC